jgi:hypothetical protein
LTDKKISENDEPGTKAIIAFTLGILSLTFCFVISVPAWFYGRNELQNIEDGLSPPKGKIYAQVGMWLGISSLIFSVLAIIFYILIIAAGLYHE